MTKKGWQLAFPFGSTLVATVIIVLAATPLASMVASAQDMKTYKIGYIGPITGPNTSVGVGTMNSLELAIRQANKSGELPFKLEFVTDTDESRPAAGVAAVQRMCGDPSILAVSAHWNSPVAMATGPYFEDCDLLNIIAGASANAITEQGWKSIGRINTPFHYAFPHLAKVLVEDLGIKTVAIIHSLDDYGNDIADEFTAEFTELGGEIVHRDGYNVGDRDFTSIITKMRSSRPEAVMHGGLSTEAALIVRQMRQLGMQQPFLGQSGQQTLAYIEAAGAVGDGSLVVSLIPFPEELPGGEQFLKDYAAAGFSDPPDVYGPFGYGAGQVIIELLKQFGPDRKALVENYRSAEPIETVLGTRSFDENGELQPKMVGIAILEDGAWRPFDAEEYKAKYMK